MNSLRPFIAWAIGPWIAALFVWIGKQTGEAVDPNLVAQTTERVIDLMLLLVPLLLSLSGVSKQVINRWVNPLNVSVNPDTVVPVAMDSSEATKTTISRQTDFGE